MDKKRLEIKVGLFVFIGLALLTWYVLQPSLTQAVHLKPGWIALMFLRNMALLWLVSGSLHLVLYTLRLHGDRRKYHPQWQAVNSKKFLFGNQVFDNVLRSSLIGCPIWTAYEVLNIWGAANHWWPYLSPAQHMQGGRSPACDNPALLRRWKGWQCPRVGTA